MTSGMISKSVLKGMQGELVILDRLRLLKNKYRFEYIHDMPVRKTDGDFQQCDFVVIATTGSFALEIKNWRGILECEGCTNRWNLNVESRRISVCNPILQNASHIKWLRESYGIRCENIVLFADTCQLLDPPVGVYNFTNLERLFTMSPERVSWDEVQRQYQILKEAKDRDSLQAIAQRYVKWSSRRGALG